MLEVKDGSFYYDKEKIVFNNLNFKLNAGEIMAVMGKNGIGKTTLLKCIAGLLKWKSGEAKINDRIIDEKSLNQLGYVPQAHKTSFSYKVFEMVLFGKIGHNSYFSVPKPKDYEEVERVLVRMGINELRDKPCNELSGGQLQLVFIARALINYPKLLILDEPEAHLDFRNQISIMKIIKEYVDEYKISCIINTHYINYAIGFADKCLLLGGSNYKVGEISEILNEENIKEYFSVISKKIVIKEGKKEFTNFVFADAVDS